ncbi:MAG: phage Tail Collar [Parcubacteria bacterium C7867-007]|nr:MAG: phage Tail Collar [Parcubacteria bacterium C7867-007]
MNEEEINTDELDLNQQIAVLMRELPKPVQDFLKSPERDAVSLELSTKYSLHADQAGVFSRAYLFMLLGVYTPDEFIQELREAGISEPSIQGITADVNERVFKRLQNAERSYVAPVPVQPAPVTPIQVPVQTQAVPPAPVTPPVVPIQPVPAAPVVPISMPTPFGPVPKSMPSVLPQVTAPLPPPVPMPVPPPEPVVPAYVAPEVQQQAVRTMAHDMQMMKEAAEHPHPVHHEPVPVHANSTPPAISWQPNSPARSFQTSSVPNTLAAPSIHPAPTVPVPPMPAAPPIPSAPAPVHPLPPSAAPVPHNLPTQPAAYPWQQQQTVTPPTMPQANGIPIVKEYGVDPYREVPQ